MICIKGQMFARCNFCGKLQKIIINTGYMDANSISENRPMGVGYEYSFSQEYECECGRYCKIIVTGSEYPIGTVELGNILIENAEITNKPQIEAYYEPDEFTQEPLLFDNIEVDPKQIIYNMDNRQFELFTASILYELGYSEVLVTIRTRDGAYDFSAIDNRYGIKKYIIGECKHYSSGHKVNEDVIRKLHDAQYQQRANSAVVVTSSSFTRDAKARADEYRMTLWDIDDLVHYGKDILKDYF